MATARRQSTGCRRPTGARSSRRGCPPARRCPGSAAGMQPLPGHYRIGVIVSAGQAHHRKKRLPDAAKASRIIHTARMTHASSQYRLRETPFTPLIATPKDTPERAPRSADSPRSAKEIVAGMPRGWYRNEVRTSPSQRHVRLRVSPHPGHGNPNTARKRHGRPGASRKATVAVPRMAASTIIPGALDRRRYRSTISDTTEPMVMDQMPPAIDMNTNPAMLPRKVQAMTAHLCSLSNSVNI